MMKQVRALLTVGGIGAVVGGALVFGLVWTFGADWFGSDTETKVTYKEKPLPWSDLYGAMPDRIEVHPADTSDTEEACITAPGKLARKYERLRMKRESARTDSPHTPVPEFDSSRGLPPPEIPDRFRADLTPSTRPLNAPFLLLPVTEDGPAVDVNSDRTRIQTYSPLSAEAKVLQFDHPKDLLRIEPVVETEVTPTDFRLSGEVEARFVDLLPANGDLGVFGGAETSPFAGQLSPRGKVGLRWYPFKIGI